MLERASEEPFYLVGPVVVFFVSPKRLPAVLLATIVSAPAAVVLLDRSVGGLSMLNVTIRGNVGTLELTLCAATGIFLWALGERVAGILTAPPMRFLGKISYSFYLIHESALLLAERYLHQRYVIAGLAFAASVGFASASWYLMEGTMLDGGSKHL